MLTSSVAKRRRDDDEEAAEEQPQKRSRSRTFFPLERQSAAHELPLRPSVSPPRLWGYGFPEAMTPAHSESSDASPVEEAFPSGDVEMDDDDLDIICSQPPDSPVAPFLRPPRLNAQLFQEPSSGGRIPTPIAGTFYPRLPSRGVSDISTMEEEESPGVSVLVRKQPGADRRMPSPISEDEATETQLSRLSVGGVEEEMEDVVRSPTMLAKTGRARSGAITEKVGRKFSMGFRDDCDKCRAKVPGHYAHFLPA